MLDFKKYDKSIILVNHNASDVKQLCDRYMFVKHVGLLILLVNLLKY